MRAAWIESGCTSGEGGPEGQRAGFTLVEIMIALTIVGILAMLAIPAFQHAKWNAAAARYAADVRTATAAFEMYAMENGNYPPDRGPEQVPPGMGPYLTKVHWDKPTSLGGGWDWDYRVFGVIAGVSVYKPDAPDDELRIVDDILDDGNLGSGMFRSRPDGYIYVIEE